DVQFNAHLRQQILKPEALGRFLHPPIQFPHFVDGNKPLSQCWYACKSLNLRQHFRPRLISVQTVGWHAREITQALCGRMKNRLKASEMSIERNSKVTKSSGQWLVVSASSRLPCEI